MRHGDSGTRPLLVNIHHIQYVCAHYDHIYPKLVYVFFCHFAHVIQKGGLHTYSTSRRSLNKRRVWMYRNKCVRTRAVYQSNARKRTQPDVRALKWADVDACARTWTRTHALGCGCIRADVLRLRQTRVLKAGYSRPPPGIGLYTCVLFYVLWRLPFSTY